MTFEFRKRNGVWQRRRTKTGNWQTLTIERAVIRNREKYRQRDGTIVEVETYGNHWTWHD